MSQQQYYELRQQSADLTQLSDDLVMRLTKVQDDVSRGNSTAVKMVIESEQRSRRDLAENADELLNLLMENMK